MADSAYLFLLVLLVYFYGYDVTHRVIDGWETDTFGEGGLFDLTFATPNENRPCSGYLKDVLVSKSVLYVPLSLRLPFSSLRNEY